MKNKGYAKFVEGVGRQTRCIMGDVQTANDVLSGQDFRKLNREKG